MLRPGVAHHLTFYVDGACRNNGRLKLTPVAAAAACLVHSQGTQRHYDYKSRVLDAHPRPTNQRAELVAIKMALDWALDECKEEYLREKSVVIQMNSDSRYAVGCMSQWLTGWVHNGWIKARGGGVANRDLLEALFESQRVLKEFGQGRVTIRYEYVPRAETASADQHANAALDEHLKIQP